MTAYNMNNDVLDIILTTDPSEVAYNVCHGIVIMIVTEGKGSMLYGERIFHFSAHDMVISAYGDRLKKFDFCDDIQLICIIIPHETSKQLQPVNNYSSGASVSLWNTPVMPLDDECEKRILSLMELIKWRMRDSQHGFQKEVVSSLVLALLYDIV